MQNKFDFKKINGWLDEYKSEQLTAYLEPRHIKDQIKRSAAGPGNDFSNVIIEVMTKEEYEGRTARLNINYSFSLSRFGKVIIASTSKGICYLGFADSEKEAIDELKRRFPYASLIGKRDECHDNAFAIVDNAEGTRNPVRLHLKGTIFQIDIWKKLLTIPFGGLVSYASLAGDAKKSRAVGTAVAGNPIGYLIPCHRVVRATGEFGEYYWGADRKAALISWEAALTDESILRKKRVFRQPVAQ